VRNRRLAPVIALLLTIAPIPAATVLAQPGCDPFTTPPVFGETVPSLAFGAQEVTVAESNAYLAAVDAASDRVITDVAAVSVGGLEIPYAVVGTEARIAALATALAQVNAIRNPATEQADVTAAIEAGAPVVLWVAANVHGGEESGADASLEVLYNLASRTDCVVDDILGNAIVVIMPIQNPDGREAETRRNLYGFDMNRDWFARTQPETDGKLEVVRQYPPMLFIDAHEFGLPNYFFPPNADPEYHEIPDTAHDWINNLYSPAIAGQFDKEGIKFFHGAPYDFFAMIFGDTVPAEGFHAAGMTFEKEGGDPIAVREHEHFTSMWASLFAGATNRAAVLQAWHDSYVEALSEGENGQLEENNVFEPKHKLYQEVPDIAVRSYFVPNDPDRQYELDLLVRRLQRMDVEVRRLTAPLLVDTYHPYGDEVVDGQLLLAGTYWIPLAQAQKHWVQAMLHEESWIPFDVTYDVTAWSNPLLMNLQGGWTGDVVSAASEVVAPVAAPAWPGGSQPSVGLFEIPNSTRGFEAAGQARYLFNEVWDLDFTDVTAADITAGLSGVDVLVIPDGYANYGVQALGAKGKRALRDWVNGGGRIVAWQGGAEVAVKAGVSTAKFAGSHTNMPGTLVRVSLDSSSPLAAGVGDRDWVMYLDDRTMQPGLGAAVGTIPAAGDPDYATSGLAIGVGTLAGTSVLADEAVGNGRVVSFSIDPNFRAWTQGTQRLLWNAIVGPDPSAARGLFAGSRERAAAEKAALDAAAKLPDLGSAIRVRVALKDAKATAQILGRRSSEVVRIDLGSETLFLVGNKKDLSFEEHAWFALAIREMEQAGIQIRAASVP
jgi:hypothetical protein